MGGMIMTEGMMNERHLIRIFKLNPHMYLHGFDANGQDKAKRFREVCQRLMKFTVEGVARGLEDVMKVEPELSRLSYVFKVHDLLLANEKKNYEKPMALSMGSIMRGMP
jgi:hypothetical protein